MLFLTLINQKRFKLLVLGGSNDSSKSTKCFEVVWFLIELEHKLCRAQTMMFEFDWIEVCLHLSAACVTKQTRISVVEWDILSWSYFLSWAQTLFEFDRTEVSVHSSSACVIKQTWILVLFKLGLFIDQVCSELRSFFFFLPFLFIVLRYLSKTVKDGLFADLFQYSIWCLTSVISKPKIFWS